MAAKRLGFKPTLRDARLSSNAGQSFYAQMMERDDPRRAPALERLAAERDAIAPVRKRAAPRQLEAPVVAAISELLAVHPSVMWAARFNSGMASYNTANGKYAPVWFHKFLRMPEPMVMPDFFGLMYWKAVDSSHVDGTPFPFAIEAKAPGWTKPRDDRERKQAAFLAMVRNCGGVALFATSAEQVAEALA